MESENTVVANHGQYVVKIIGENMMFDFMEIRL
jgi:class 3 adenylate cyclase